LALFHQFVVTDCERTSSRYAAGHEFPTRPSLRRQWIFGSGVALIIWSVRTWLWIRGDNRRLSVVNQSIDSIGVRRPSDVSFEREDFPMKLLAKTNVGRFRLTVCSLVVRAMDFCLRWGAKNGRCRRPPRGRGRRCAGRVSCASAPLDGEIDENACDRLHRTELSSLRQIRHQLRGFGRR
jgi:hypothetical protein